MSFSENNHDELASETTAPGVISNDPAPADTEGPTTVEARKRAVRQFLNKYRSLGLPGAKKTRRKHRISLLTEERDFFKNMLFNSAKLQAQANVLIADLINESNFCSHDTGEDNLLIEWVADDELLEKARKYLKQFSEAGLLQQRPPVPEGPTTRIESGEPSLVPTAQVCLP